MANLNNGNIDNMKVRKEQLEKLDDFVKELYDECKTLTKYSGTDFSDLEMLYLHIHEMIEEMLQVKTTQEFMEMMAKVHQAIAGVLIVISKDPSKSAQVKQDMQEVHPGFQAENIDDLVDQLHKTSVEKYGNQPQQPQADEEEAVENDPDEAVETLGLQDHVTKKSKGVRTSKYIKDKPQEGDDEEWEPRKRKTKRNEETPDGHGTPDEEDPMGDVYKEFN